MLRSSSPVRHIDTEALKRERPLADVVASYGIALRRESAGTYRALCPFHQEHTPSFWIDARSPAESGGLFWGIWSPSPNSICPVSLFSRKLLEGSPATTRFSPAPRAVLFVGSTPTRAA